MKVSLIACSRDGSCPTLSKSFVQNVGPFSLENYGQSSVELICEKEELSIAKGFNRAAAKSRGDVLVFTHDDVAVLSSRHMFWDACRLASKERTGVVGVAGTRNMGTNYWWEKSNDLSGACMHGDGKDTWATTFGKFGRVVTIDGVFQMVRRDVFNAVGGFDETFEFDFYDMDFTFKVHLAGYENMTFPLHLLHMSVGNGAGQPPWLKMRDKFVKKFKHELPASL